MKVFIRLNYIQNARLQRPPLFPPPSPPRYHKLGPMIPTGTKAALERLHAHTEKSFRNLIKSNQNQIVFNNFPIDLEQQTDNVCLLFQINRKMVNTI